MERLFKNLTVAILALGLFLAPVASADDSFKPPAAISVTDAFSILFYTTNQIMPDAFVVLHLCLNRKGGTQRRYSGIRFRWPKSPLHQCGLGNSGRP
jgi:hypothetical protein